MAHESIFRSGEAWAKKKGAAFEGFQTGSGVSTNLNPGVGRPHRYIRCMHDPNELARRVVERMMQGDAFSHWLGIEVLMVVPGCCELRMAVRGEMDNGFHITHGGIAYSLADSALAFASNAHGIHAVSIDTSISHVKPVKAGDVLTARAEESSRSNRIGIYHVRVANQEGTVVALFKGTVYRTGKEWFGEG